MGRGLLMWLIQSGIWSESARQRAVIVQNHIRVVPCAVTSFFIPMTSAPVLVVFSWPWQWPELLGREKGHMDQISGERQFAATFLTPPLRGRTFRLSLPRTNAMVKAWI